MVDELVGFARFWRMRPQQINAASAVRLKNCIIDNLTTTVVRQNGGTTYKVDVALDACRIMGPQTAVLRSDSPACIGKLINSYVRMTGAACYGVLASCTYTNTFSY